MSSNTASSGTLALAAFFPLSDNIPSIITEWSALVPLVIHLANYGEDHRMVGELALAGYLTVGLFPKLGYLDGIWRLLQGGSDFLDRANAKSESNYKVWDVNWGSVFTRVNGSAITIITNYALRKRREPMKMPEEVLAQPSQMPGVNSVPVPTSDLHAKVKTKSCFRRHQDLHIVCMSRKNHNRSLRGTVLNLILSRFGELSYHFLLVGLIILLCLLGAFGSAAVITNGLVSKLVCRLLRAERPSGYLASNENHNACMLSAVHENATTWYLYMGDRGVIDWLLNKSMLSTPSPNRLLTTYFRIAHVSQLLAMTFVAAQKGLDGISLVVLLLASHAFQYLFGGHRLARQWLEAEHVSIDAHTFRFSGRTPMIGAIHMISEARDAAWMDTLLAPCPRIKVWLDEMKCAADVRGQLDLDMKVLSSSDRAWVLLNAQLAIEAGRLIRRTLSQGKTTESLYVRESK